MARELTRRQERFCLEWFRAKGIARHAYLRAGYNVTSPNVADVCASRLLTNAKVRDRLKEIQAMVKQRAADVTADSIIDELEQARLMAMSERQVAPAVSASVAKAKLVGLMVERKEIGNAGEFAGMSEQQLRDYITGKAVDEPMPNHPGSEERQ